MLTDLGDAGRAAETRSYDIVTVVLEGLQQVIDHLNEHTNSSKQSLCLSGSGKRFL